jgi:hypothetical protein
VVDGAQTQHPSFLGDIEMKQWFAVGTLVLAGTLVGCGEQNKVEKKTTVTTPHGSTTVTHKETVEKTGDHKTDAKDADTARPVETTPPADTPAAPTEPKAE